MKNILKGGCISFVMLLFSQLVYGQQMPQYSQYMHNPFLINPAFAGAKDYVDVTLGYRQQWAGFDGAPSTFYASGHTNLSAPTPPSFERYAVPVSRPELFLADSTGRKIKHGIGAIFAHDEYGAFKKTSATLGYAIHLPVGKKENYISIGANLGWAGVGFNKNMVQLENPVDNTYLDFIAGGNNVNLADINLGALFYGKNFFVGYSGYQLLENQLRLGNEDPPAELSDSRLQLHHYGLAGYKFDITANFALMPSVLVKFMTPSPASFDINLTAHFQNKFWLGASYRNEDAIAAMLGLTINDLVRIGYSYDYTISEINNYSNGSHEIVLGLMLQKQNR